MGRWIWYGLFGVVVFLVTLVWTAPLSFFVAQANLPARGVYFERAQGTIWSGDLLGVNWAGQPVGTISLEAKPALLLSGRLAFDMDVRGPAGIGRGSFITSLGGGMQLKDVVADINVQQLRRLDPRLRQVPSSVSLTLPDLVTKSDLTCERADGRLKTDLLEKLGTGLQWSGPSMAGIIACDGDGGYQVALSNVGGSDTISVNAMASPRTGAYEAEARVQTSTRSVADALVVLGFQRDGSEFVYSRANGVVRSIGEAG